MELSKDQQRIKERFQSSRGYWNEYLDGMLELDPEFLEAYLSFSEVPWKTGVLEPKFKELIYIALDGSATHLYVDGLRQHIRNALAHGATTKEIMEVLELVSVVGIHACTVGVPILIEEANSRENPGATTGGA